VFPVIVFFQTFNQLHDPSKYRVDFTVRYPSKLPAYFNDIEKLL
jgi:hypothetical protein